MEWVALKVYNKAVRDRIPEIIRDSGQRCETRSLSDAEYLPELEKKLGEELDEYLKSGSLEELADILEVVHRIAELRESNFNEVDEIRLEKKVKRGGFEGNIFLVEVY